MSSDTHGMSFSPLNNVTAGRYIQGIDTIPTVPLNGKGKR